MANQVDDASAIFSNFQKYLDEEQDTKEVIRLAVRELEQKAREILAILQGIHQQDGITHVKDITSRCRALYGDIQTLYAALASKVPQDQFYRFHDHWRFVTQRLCFQAALIVYLESEMLITREECAKMMGVHIHRSDGFHVDLDDFLMGLLQLASELSRLSVNAVTAGDYRMPRKIAKFVAELDAGFRLLNLKNDSLRKRFDALKYDLKKVEEVVYDITIRELNPVEEDSAAAQPTA